MSNTQLSIHFFLQLTVILAICRVVGMVAKRIGQPQVVGEMIAGVLMGPSLFGYFWPELQQLTFPKGPSMSIIYAVSQVGLVLYMFLIGVEFDTGLIRHRLRSAASVSIAGILVPLTLGSILAYSLIGQTGFFGPEVIPWQAMLFLGAAISITAFPMLARIIFERGLSGTSLGTLALAAGSIDDAVSWCILAVVLAVFNQNPLIAYVAIGGGLLYAITVLLVVRPALRPMGAMAARQGEISGGMLAFTLLLLMLCAWITDVIGIYAIFGAFLLGTAMPRGFFAKRLQQIVEPVTTNFLLPLFFIYSGLNTSITLVNTWWLWGVALLVLGIAIMGKGVACYFAARATGEPNREALAIGSLMNARGLMELILLNIGLEHGIITPTLFTILVFMAIITTLMASPIFEFVYRRFRTTKTTAPVVAPGMVSAPVEA